MAPTRRRRAAVAALVVVGAGCGGSARTAFPTSLLPAQPVAQGTSASLASTTTATGPATTASGYVGPGEKHQLAGGTLAVSYPASPVRPPRGQPTLPAGSVYAVVNVKFCAAKDGPLAGALVDPARFVVEVPGQGLVRFDPAVPGLRGSPLPVGAEVAPGRCLEGSITYRIAGELHVESILYDRGDGLLRWAA